MSKVIQRAWLHFLISIIAMGCASTAKMRPEANPNIVVLQSYPVSYETAFKKVLQTLDFKSMSIKEASKERHFIIAKSGLRVGFGEGGWGNLIGIYFKERSPLVTEISIAQENWSKLQMIETDETYDLLSLFKNTLKE